MIIIQQVYIDENVRGIAYVDSTKDFFLVTYIDYELCLKLNKIIQFKNIPYSKRESGLWNWGRIIETNE